jgi:hypothetical protein
LAWPRRRIAATPILLALVGVFVAARAPPHGSPAASWSGSPDELPLMTPRRRWWAVPALVLDPIAVNIDRRCRLSVVEMASYMPVHDRT